MTEEGIANLLLCRTPEEREQAIRGVAGYTPVGIQRDEARKSYHASVALFNIQKIWISIQHRSVVICWRQNQ